MLPSAMLRTALVACAIALLALPARAADPKDPLARARVLYNQRQFDASLAAAEEARRLPDRADSADLVAARAYLERFREGAVAEDLASARERLRRLDPARFTASEHFEYLVGLGETLYLDDDTGAAAVIFESVLTPDEQLSPEARERVLDWWASALDRDARPRPEIDRRAIYQRVRDRMAAELAVHPGSSTAAYWASAAARGQGDLQAAWDAAQAGWVRASLSPTGGTALRNDLDRLMQRAIVPERSRILAQPPETLIAEWEQFKEKWRDGSR
jgi:hypothetical protein